MIPSDYLHPEWNKKDRIHNWRNYISNELIEMWETFTDEQKIAISRNAANMAMAEEWD